MGIEFFGIEQASLVGWLTRRDYPEPFPLDGGHWHPFELEWRHHRRFRRHQMIDDGLESAGYPDAWRAPRTTTAILSTFLRGLPDAVAARFEEDHALLRKLIEESLRRLASIVGHLEPGDSGRPVPMDARSVLSSTEVARVLGPLRWWLDVPFYFMPLGQETRLDEVSRSPEWTMWLLCRADAQAHDLLDPFPAIAKGISALKKDNPVTVCWGSSGRTIVVPAKEAPVETLLALARQPETLWRELSAMDRKTGPKFNILQLSDLHFGSKQVTSRQIAYVETHLRDKMSKCLGTGGVVQPMITGDLMDTPSKKNLADFEAFRQRLEAMAATHAVCIPGNHDMKRKGFLWGKWEAVAGLEWQSVMRSAVGGFGFVCFNTSQDANLARGRITNEHFLEVKAKLDNFKMIEKCDDHIFLALVHHHPFSVEDDEVDTVPFLGIKEEPYLRMENGEQLVKWCAGNDIPLILHGHKHKPRFVGREVVVEGRARTVRAIGCGASFGVEGKPLSYNWITWDPGERSWSVAYFADPGDGSGYRESRLVLGSFT